MNITINLTNGEITSYDALSISMSGESGEPVLTIETTNGDVINFEFEQMVSFQIQKQADAVPTKPAEDNL